VRSSQTSNVVLFRLVGDRGFLGIRNTVGGWKLPSGHLTNYGKCPMRRRAFIMGIVAMLLAASWASSSMAAEIKVGGTFEVKANSIWFEDAAKLLQWQKLQKRGNAKALASYEDKTLSNRAAWKFVNPLIVKIIGFERGRHQVKVEMMTPGRILDSTWFLDTAALQQ